MKCSWGEYIFIYDVTIETIWIAGLGRGRARRRAGATAAEQAREAYGVILAHAIDSN